MNQQNNCFSQDYFISCLKENYEKEEKEIKSRIDRAGNKEEVKNFIAGIMAFQELACTGEFEKSIKHKFEVSYSLGATIQEVLDTVKDEREKLLYREEFQKSLIITETHRISPTRKYRLLNKIIKKTQGGEIVHIQKFAFLKQLRLLFKIAFKKDSDSAIVGQCIENGVFLNDKSVKLIIDCNNFDITNDDPQFYFDAYIKYVTFRKIIEFLPTYCGESGASPISETTLNDSGDNIKDDKYAKIKYNVKNRDDWDNMTSLSRNQTVLLFHYLRKKKVIVGKSYLSNTDLAKIIRACSGYSEKTTRMLLSEYVKEEFSDEDLRKVKENLNEIIYLINNKLK